MKSSPLCEAERWFISGRKASRVTFWSFGARRGLWKDIYSVMSVECLGKNVQDFELSPHQCSCWTLVVVACAFLFIWQHAASILTPKSFLSQIIPQLTGLPSQQQMGLTVGTTCAATRRLLKDRKHERICNLLCVCLENNLAFVLVSYRWCLRRKHHKSRALMQRCVSTCSWVLSVVKRL